MSTRAWYEYYVVDAARNDITLAFQFYKWGDGGPENALTELAFLNKKVHGHQGQLPAVWLDGLLREQLGELYPVLPDHFSLAAFLFLLQRANEEMHRWTPSEYSKMPKEQRPDYRLGFAIGYAIAVNAFQPQRHIDPHLDRVLTFIATGHFVRPWKHYGLRLSVLQWLQYLTQVTFEKDMGSISGDFAVPRFDISFIHRFFIWTNPDAPDLIDRIAIQLCDCDGADLLSPPPTVAGAFGDDHAYQLKFADELTREIGRLGTETWSLSTALESFRMTPDHFWKLKNYERPAIIPETISGSGPGAPTWMNSFGY